MPEFKDVRRNVGIFTARGGTIGYLVTPDAVVVIDSQFADTAPMFLEGLKPKTTRKIDFLINSHHHPRPHRRQQGDAADRWPRSSRTPTCPVCSASRRPRRRAKTTRRTRTRRSTRTGRRRSARRRCRPGTTGRRTPAATSSITFENANIVHMGDLMSFQRNPRADRPAGASIATGCRVLENIGQGPQQRHGLHLRPLEGRRARHRVEQGPARAARLLHRDAGLREEADRRRAVAGRDRQGNDGDSRASSATRARPSRSKRRSSN